ncbi:MAG: hypothetical protein WBL20_06585 [Sphingobium sp.]
MVKLPERLGRRSGRPFHSAIATSFAVEFAAVEEILLPQLMASGASNLLLLTDERMAALALSDGSTLPTTLGRDYALHSPPSTDGIFHPKIILQIGRDGGRAFVSSANLTAAGLAGNAEVSIEIECKDDDSPERAIIRSIWHYLDALVPSEPSPARDALRWARERAGWLDGAEEPVLQELDDGSAIAFVHAPGEQGIGDRFVSFVGDAPVQTLVVISPYWDHDLATLAGISRRLSPKRIILPIDCSNHEFPVDASFASKPRIVDLDWPSQRFTHAKILIASTGQHDHILFGSANCTTAALGREGSRGANAEACIYRRLPKGMASEALALDRWIDGDAIALADLPPPVETPSIPLKAIEGRQPGTFELDHGTLLWCPAPSAMDAVEVELLDGAARLLQSIPIASFVQLGERRSAPVDQSLHAKLRFAQTVAGDVRSMLAHISHRETLRGRRREVATGSIARALAPFTDGADFDFWMHQAFETLVRADFEQESEPRALAAARPQTRKSDGEPTAPVSLSYEEFTQARLGAGRFARQGANSLAGTYSDNIRDFLNLLSGRGPAPTLSEEDDPAYQDPMEEGGDPDSDEDEGTASPAIDREPVSQAADHAAVDAALYERHVVAYAEALEWGEGPLGSSDVLRLRFWILFLLYKARCSDLPRGLDGSSAVQSWPRFIVRILVGFFCGRRPAIARLMIARDYSGMPSDFMECWVTALWSLDTIERVLADRPKDRQFLKYIPELRRRVLLILALSPDELNSVATTELRDGLDRSIGLRLGRCLNRTDSGRVPSTGVQTLLRRKNTSISAERAAVSPEPATASRSPTAGTPVSSRHRDVAHRNHPPPAPPLRRPRGP